MTPGADTFTADSSALIDHRAQFPVRDRQMRACYQVKPMDLIVQGADGIRRAKRKTVGTRNFYFCRELLELAPQSQNLFRRMLFPLHCRAEHISVDPDREVPVVDG